MCLGGETNGMHFPLSMELFDAARMGKFRTVGRGSPQPSQKGDIGMRKMKRLTAAAVAAVLAVGSAVPVFADASDTYVALGADLSVKQRSIVLDLMDLTEDDLANMDVVQITNQKEREVLGDYLPSSVIGSRALSCVKVEKKKSNGITVTTKNISYCTEGMYQNALITAGIENADVVVVAPSNISGTAGLVGTMEAYQEITGNEISESNKDAAVNEIVATGELADQLGSTESAENLVALVKQNVVANGISSEEDLIKVIDDAAAQIGVTLSDDDKQQMLSLMKKIGELDLDVDSLKEQASGIYDRLADLGVDMSGFDKEGIIDAIANFFAGIAEFFKGLFS